MPRMKIKECERISKMIRDDEWFEIGYESLRGYIIRNIGGDERTISSYIKIMLEVGLLEDIGHMHFKVKDGIDKLSQRN